MATWQDLRSFISSEYRPAPERDDDQREDDPEYRIIESSEDEIRILVEYEDDRSQIILVCHERLDNREDWVQLVSVIGRASDADMRKVLEELGQVSAVCGAVIIGDHLVLRHSLPLVNLDINEFVDPLNFVAETADHLEEQFFHEDDH